MPGVYALCIITILQFLNIFFLALLLSMLGAMKIDQFSNVIIVITILSLLAVDYFYIYKKKGKNQILLKYSAKTPEIKKVKKFSFLYIAITLLSFLGLLNPNLFFK